MPTSTTSDITVLGAGAIGAAVAWRCAQRGLTVTLVDPAPSRGAWNTAAGMLAPVTELHYTETPLLRLNLASLAQYPAFAAELADESGRPTGLTENGTLQVAWDGADFAALRELHEFGRTLGVATELLGEAELRALEPALAPGLPGGLLAAGDQSVDPRLLHAALVTACRRRGVRFVESSGTVLADEDRVRGVRVGGVEISSPVVVLAAGAWTGTIEGVPTSAAVPVRPVKGQTLRLRLDGPTRLNHVVRAAVRGSSVYVVPRADGQLVVGASTEEAGFDPRPRAGAVYELLRDAQTVLPELSEATWDEVSTSFRPGSPDNAPIVGPTRIPGLLAATGHYRNGILLTPITASGVADLVTTGTLPGVLAPFTPARFAEAT